MPAISVFDMFKVGVGAVEFAHARPVAGGRALS